MDPNVAFFVVLGLCLAGAIIFLASVVLNPFVWTALLVLGIAFFGLKTCSQVINSSGSGEALPRLSADNLISMMSLSLNTSTGPGQDVEHFAIKATGSITNHSNREITHMRLWCRAEAIHGSEMESGWMVLPLKPGETKAFSGQVTGRFSGITKSGQILRVPPERHFCRVAEFTEK